MKELSDIPSGLELLKMDSREGSRTMSSFSLTAQRDLVLKMAPGRRRQDLILLSDQAQALTRVLPPEELVLTIKEIGEVDALPLLELSSNDQLNYLLDLDIWLQADLDMNQLNQWIRLLLESGEDRTRRWLENCDFELLLLLFERSVLLLNREALDGLPESMLARVVTPDDYHYLVIKVGADLENFRELVKILFAQDRERFFALTGNLGTTPPAEVEELSLRWRNGRLADRGWPDLDEAQVFYQPLDPEKLPPDSRLPSSLNNPPRYNLVARSEELLLHQGLAWIQRDDLRNQLASQLANLTNRVLIADGWPMGELRSLEKASTRVMGRLEIGFETLGVSDGQGAAQTMATTPLLHLARIGQREILLRRERALRLRSVSGAELLKLMSPPLPDRLDSLCLHRPEFLPQSGALARDFASLRDLSALDRDLDKAEAALLLAQSLKLTLKLLPDPFPAGCHPESLEGLSLETLLLSAHGRYLLGLEGSIEPIPAGRVADLLSAMGSDTLAVVNQLQSWSNGLLTAQPPGLEALLADLARLSMEQLGSHDPSAVDPRFIDGLWIQRPVGEKKSPAAEE